jgi:hypothetical protein
MSEDKDLDFIFNAAKTQEDGNYSKGSYSYEVRNKALYRYVDNSTGDVFMPYNGTIFQVGWDVCKKD